MPDQQVTVIGCGLIGGSVCLALKRRRPACRIVGLDLQSRLAAIQDAGVADEADNIASIPRHVPHSHFVILSAPVGAILRHLESIAPHLAPGAVVLDVGSTKTLIMKKARDVMPRHAHFIGGHPMAGSERAGADAADPLLFSDKVFLLCPESDTPMEALLAAIDFVEDLQARPVTIEPEEHDRIMATVSHVPQLIAVALMHAAMAEDAAHGLLDTVAGRGFLDLTRLAASDHAVWKSILSSNSAAISESLDHFERSLTLLRQGLGSDAASPLWQAAAGRRREMGLDSLPRMRRRDYRGLIDRYDKQLLSALGHRMQTARRLGRLKRSQEAPVVDPERERQLLSLRKDWGRSLDLPADFIEDLFSLILRHSTRSQAE